MGQDVLGENKGRGWQRDCGIQTGGKQAKKKIHEDVRALRDLKPGCSQRVGGFSQNWPTEQHGAGGSLSWRKGWVRWLVLSEMPGDWLLFNGICSTLCC